MKFRCAYATLPCIGVFLAVFFSFGSVALGGVDLVSLNITTTEPDPTSVDPIPVTFTFGEAVSGFDVSDVTPTNGTLSNFAGSGDTYSVDVSPIAEGIVQIDVAQGAGTGDISSDDTAAGSLSITYDLAPTFTTTFGIVGGVIQVTVTFNEDVTGFDAGDITVINGTLANFAGVGDTYTFEVLSPTGKVTVQIADAAAQDMGGNNSVAATPMFMAPSLPDLRLGGKATFTSHKGDNDYSAAKFKKGRIKGSATFFASIENDGIATDTFGGRTGKARNFKVTYKSVGGGNITGSLKSGTYTTTLASGAIQNIKATVKPSKKSNRGQTFKDSISIWAVADSAANDEGSVKLKFLPSASTAPQGGNTLDPSNVGPGINP